MSLDNLGQIIVWLITGALAGFMAAQVFRKRGFGIGGNILLGLVGAFLGGVIFNLLNIRISGLPELRFSFADLLVAFIGALVLLVVLELLLRRRLR